MSQSLRYSGTLRIPGLGVELPVEVDLELAEAPPAQDASMDEAALRERWGGASPRTIKRLRDRGVLPYMQVSPRKYRYRLEDVRAYEAARHRGVARRRSA